MNLTDRHTICRCHLPMRPGNFVPGARLRRVAAASRLTSSPARTSTSRKCHQHLLLRPTVRLRRALPLPAHRIPWFQQSDGLGGLVLSLTMKSGIEDSDQAQWMQMTMSSYTGDNPLYFEDQTFAVSRQDSANWLAGVFSRAGIDNLERQTARLKQHREKLKKKRRDRMISSSTAPHRYTDEPGKGLKMVHTPTRPHTPQRFDFCPAARIFLWR